MLLLIFLNYLFGFITALPVADVHQSKIQHCLTVPGELS